jgi:ABC-type Na+ transport system ATPase subunit NatA
MFENTELHLRMSHIEEEFDKLKSLHENIILDWRNGLDKIDSLNHEIEQIIQDYEKKIEFLNENTRKEELKLLDENLQLRDKFKAFKKEIIKELNIKDLIINRHTKFEGVLKKELFMAKNILKDPSLSKKAERLLNFDCMPVSTSQ